MCPGGLSGGPGILAGGPGVLSGGPGGLSGCPGYVWCLWFHLARLCLEAWVFSLPSVLGAYGFIEPKLSGAAFEGVKHVSKLRECWFVHYRL